MQREFGTAVYVYKTNNENLRDETLKHGQSSWTLNVKRPSATVWEDEDEMGQQQKKFHFD